MRNKTKNISKTLLYVVAFLWSVFQLSTLSWLVLDSFSIKSIHLSFAIALCFLNKDIKQNHTGKEIFLIVLAAAGALSALYVFMDYQSIVEDRMGDPITRDLLFGGLLILLLLEATRSSIGMSLPIICACFIVYVFMGPHLPGILASKGISISRFFSQITLDTQGIFGIPLNASACIVFPFVLFGAMLEKAGGGEFFTRLAIAGLGRFKGGAAKAAVVSSALTGMVSGSSLANVTTTGAFTIPLMKRLGYPANKAAAIEVASSVCGQLTPPVMGAAAFIIAEYVNIQYIEVAKAAAIPAFASYAALFWITHLEASKLGLSGLPGRELPSFLLELRKGLIFLFPLGILLYELIWLQHSAEFAVFHAIIAIAIIILFTPICTALVNKKPLAPAFLQGARVIADAFVKGATNMAGVAVAAGAAGIIVGCVSLGLGQQISSIVETISLGNIFLLIAITAGASVILGMGLPTTPNYIVMASLIAPVIIEFATGVTLHGKEIAVSLLAAHLFCLYFGIMADDTPPVGLAAYAGAAIANADPIKTGIQSFIYDMRTVLLPFIFLFNSDLILVGIEGWWQSLMVCIAAALGMMAATSAIMGHAIIRTNIIERMLLCVAAIFLLYPFLLTGFFIPYEQRWWGYPVGLFLLGLVAILQYKRKERS